MGDENSVGPTKFYRTRCFREIGGFVRQVMWDGIDGHRCRQLGWIAVSWDDPDLRFVHLRPMGCQSQELVDRSRASRLRADIYMGTAPIYMIASGAYRMTRPPLVTGGLAMIHGYFKAMLEGQERYGDAEFRRFLPQIPVRVLAQGQGNGDGGAQRSAGLPMEERLNHRA